MRAGIVLACYDIYKEGWFVWIRSNLKKYGWLFLIDNNIKNIDVAAKIGITGSALGQRINNGSIRSIDMVNIFESYGYGLKFYRKNNDS